MAWEWVSPLATAGGGVLGAYFVWRAGKEGREHAETVSSQQLIHARQLTYDTRRQQRLESAYVAVMEIAEQAGQWAQSAHPLFDSNPPRAVRPLPLLDEQARASALLQALGSTRVSTKFDAWSQIIQEMIHVSGLAQLFSARELLLEKGEMNPHREFNQVLKPRECKARKAIATEISLELSAKSW